MKNEINEADLNEFFCPNKNCLDYGKTGNGNIRLKEHYGKNGTALLRCITCKKCFSETRGTIFFRLHTPKEKVLQALAIFAEKGSVRGTGRATGVDKDTVSAWLKKAGEYCEEVTEYLFRDLNLSQVQIDEIWTFVKKRQKSEAR